MKVQLLKYALLLTALACLATPVNAAFVLIEDFESYSIGDFTSQIGGGNWSFTGVDPAQDVVEIVDPSATNVGFENGSNDYTGNVLAADDNNNNDGDIFGRYDFSSTGSIADGSTGTLFFQWSTRGDGFSAMRFGFDDPNDGSFDFAGHLFHRNDGTLFARDESTDNTVGSAPDGTETIYNTWMVIDNANDTYDVYIQADDPSAGFLTPTLIADDYAFNANNYTTADPITRFTWASLANQRNGGIDNIYVDFGGANLVNPVTIPEPATGVFACFMALAAGGMRATRRRA